MKSGKLVVNASPIISLAKIGCADFLSRLYGQLAVHEGVFQEINVHKEHDQAVEWLNSKDYQVLVRSVEVPAVISEWNLHYSQLPCVRNIWNRIKTEHLYIQDYTSRLPL